MEFITMQNEGEALFGRDINSLIIVRWLIVRDTGGVERSTAHLELQQQEMKSWNKQMVMIILKKVCKLKW